MGVCEGKYMTCVREIKTKAFPHQLSPFCTKKVNVLLKKCQKKYIQTFEDKKEHLDLLKFVPASGAATRMFKAFHNFADEFDPEKTKWFQHHYLQEQDNVVLAEQFLPILKEKNIDPALTYVEEIVKTIKERATFVSDFWELSSFYFEAPTDFDAKASKKAWKEGTAEIMQNVKNIIAEVEDFNQENLQEKVKGWITNEGIGFGKVMQPLRLSLVGEMKGPDLFHIMTSIGKEETLKRIDFAIEKLK